MNDVALPTASLKPRLYLLLLTLFAGAQIVWLVGTFGADYRTRAERHMQDHQDDLAALLRHETESAQRHLSVVRGQAEEVLKERVRQRVDEAADMAQAVYDQAVGKVGDQELRRMIRESLRPQRFFQGRGYYFIDDMNGNCVLLPTATRLEGTSLIDNRDDAGRYIMRELIRAVSNSERAGYVRYSWYPPGNSTQMDDKVAYARQFTPFNWLIGTGDYVSAVETGLKVDALERLRAIRLTRDGRLAVIDKEGTVRLFPDQPELEGQKVHNLDDRPESLALKAIWTKAQSGGGSVEFPLADPVSGKQRLWQAWVGSESTFNWSVAALAPRDEKPHASASVGWLWAWRYALPGLLLALVVGGAAWLGTKHGRDSHET